jgi:hypothetical protein
MLPIHSFYLCAPVHEEESVMSQDLRPTPWQTRLSFAAKSVWLASDPSFRSLG